MSHELWDTETRNLIGTFESREPALEAVRELIALNAAVYPNAMALVFEDDQGETTVIATGNALGELLRQ